jgi:hypothetical protein
MNTDGLKLPHGCIAARFIDRMREVYDYDIATDAYRARWDTIIRGKQFTNWGQPLNAMAAGPRRPIEEWLEDGRNAARVAFEAEEAPK